MVMKLLDQLVGARPATLSMEIKRCFEAARREAAVRGASLLSQSYCALVLLRHQSTRCVSMPNRPTPVPCDELIAEIMKRLPPVTRDAPRDSPPIQFHEEQRDEFIQLRARIAQTTRCRLVRLGQETLDVLIDARRGYASKRGTWDHHRRGHSRA